MFIDVDLPINLLKFVVAKGVDFGFISSLHNHFASSAIGVGHSFVPWRKEELEGFGGSKLVVQVDFEGEGWPANHDEESNLVEHEDLI